MAALPVKKIAVAGVLSAVVIVLGITRLGLLPWFFGASVTIIHIPVIIGAVLEGPLVGAFIGLLFGLFSLMQAAVAPNGPVDAAFVNPLISVLPRLLIGPAAWGLYRLIRGAPELSAGALRETAAVAAAAAWGSLVNTGLVLSGLGIFGFFPWPMIGAVALGNGPAEALVATLITVAVVSAYARIDPSGRGRSRLSDEGKS